jgi:hypothetical protein
MAALQQQQQQQQQHQGVSGAEGHTGAGVDDVICHARQVQLLQWSHLVGSGMLYCMRACE